MKMANITVSYDGTTLTLSDNGHTNAGKSEVIHWLPGAGVHSVTGISVKPSPPAPASSANFWSSPPAQNGVNFKGIISGSASGEWNYTITTDVGSIDPKIAINSGD